jgi:TPP-dependent pyruvate/acetoin dehydrogenase alpha subunit
MDKDVLEEVEDAYQFADQAPDPEAEELYKDVYSREERER